MPKSKFFLKSLTVWGAIVMALPALLAAFGAEIPPDLIAEADSAVKMLILALDEVVTGIGAVMVLIGRVRAGGLTFAVGRLGGGGLKPVVPYLALPLVLALPLGACGTVPLSTGGDVEGYEDLVTSFEASPEAAARFDVFEAQADGIQALSMLERAVTHPELPVSTKERLKSLSAILTAAIRDYTAVVTECPGKDPETGGCPDFDFGTARVLAYRSILQSVQSELLRLTAGGFLAAR